MKVYTMQDWANDGTFKAAAGQEIEEAIYEQMYNCLPPKNWHEEGYTKSFRVGEPYTHDYETGRAIYSAFGMKQGKYYYLGLRQAHGA